jgi:hypothetical protein
MRARLPKIKNRGALLAMIKQSNDSEGSGATPCGIGVEAALAPAKSRKTEVYPFRPVTRPVPSGGWDSMAMSVSAKIMSTVTSHIKASRIA